MTDALAQQAAWAMTFRDRLIEQEKRIGCSRTQVCKLLFGLSHSTYMSWIHGGIEPDRVKQELVIYRLEQQPSKVKVVRSMRDLRK